MNRIFSRKELAYSLLLAAALLLSFASQGVAGTLTISAPSFTPDDVVISDTIMSEQVRPDLVQLIGSATIASDPGSTVTLDFGGNFTADTGDMFSALYDFMFTLGNADPATYAVQAFVMPGGFPFEIMVFEDTGTIQPGTSRVSRVVSSETPISGSGTYRGVLELNFGSSDAAAAFLEGTPNTLGLDIAEFDFQLAPTAIPEPSTYALLALGCGALAVRARRGRRT